MTVEELVNIIVENGVSVGVLIYFMYNQSKTLEGLRGSINDLANLVRELISAINLPSKD